MATYTTTAFQTIDAVDNFVTSTPSTGAPARTWASDNAITDFSGSGYMQSLPLGFGLDDSNVSKITYGITPLNTGGLFKIWIRTLVPVGANPIDSNRISVQYNDNPGTKVNLSVPTANQGAWQWSLVFFFTPDSATSIEVFNDSSDICFDKIIVIPSTVDSFPTGIDGFSNTVEDLPSITAPIVGTQLESSDFILFWAANDVVATQWQVYAGSTLGNNDHFAGPVLSGTDRLQTIFDMPADESVIHFTLEYVESGITRHLRFTYQAASSDYGVSIVSPLENTQFDDSSEAIYWQALTAGVSNWRVSAGYSAGDLFSIYDSGLLPDNTRSHMLQNLPNGGESLFVRLGYESPNNTAQEIVKQYTAKDGSSGGVGPSDATFTNKDFTVFDANDFSSNIYGISNVNHWLLRTDINGATGAGCFEALPLDKPNVFSGDEGQATYSVQSANDGTQFKIYVRAQAPSGNNFYDVNAFTFGHGGNNADIYIDDVNKQGEWVWVLATSNFSSYDDEFKMLTQAGGFLYDKILMIDNSETALPNGADGYTNEIYGLLNPNITGPTKNSQLTSTTMNLTWVDNSTYTPDDWRVTAGSSLYGTQHFSSGILAGSVYGVTINDLPDDGSTIYVRVTGSFEGVLVSAVAEYIAYQAPPVITTPTGTELIHGALYRPFETRPDGGVMYKLARIIDESVL